MTKSDVDAAHLVFAVIGAAVLIMLFIIAMYHLSRVLNYTLSYESMVKETICETVKREYLKDEIKCPNLK